MKRVLSILLMTLMLWGYTYANVTLPNFKVLSNLDGLPSDMVNVICQDNLGFIWIGTDNGVARYDGYNIKTYERQLLSNDVQQRHKIHALAVDSNDMIWIGSNRGLFKINTRSEVGVAVGGEYFEGSTILSLFNDGKDMWIATSKGVCRYNLQSEEVIRYSLESGDILTNRVRHIYQDRQGNIWLLYNYGGASIYHKSRNKFIHLPAENSNQRTTLTSILFDDDDRIYATTWERGVIEIVCDEEYENFKYLHTIKPNTGITLSIIKDDLYNYYWVTTVRGIYIYEDLNNNTISYIRSGSQHTELSNESVWCSFYSPAEHTLWFGTKGGGVNQLSLGTPIIKNNRFDKIRISSNTVTSMYDKGDELWLGVRSAIMAVANKKSDDVSFITKHPWLKKIGKNANGINVITEIADRNEIWLGSRYGGVWVVSLDDKGEISNLRRLRDICNNYQISNEVQAIFADSQGRIFISCADGTLALITESESGQLIERQLNRADREESPHYMPNHTIVAIEEGNNQDILFATSESGVWRYVEQRDEVETFKQVDIINRDNDDVCEDVSSISTNSLLKMSDGTIWLATHNYGIASYNAESGQFEIEQGLLHKGIRAINSLFEDSNGDFWLGSEKGIIWYSKSRQNAMIFNHDDGLSDNIYVNNSVTQSDDGAIYYGGHNGYTMIDISTLNHNPIAPKPIITDIFIFNRSIINNDTNYTSTTKARGSNIERDKSGNISKLNIKSGDENFIIEFSTLSLQNSTKNSYEYRLIGLEDKFHKSINGENRAIYSNLGSGHYTFEVYGYNNFGVRSEEATTLSIYVQPKWYNSFWAWVAWILLPLSIIGLAINYIIIKVRYRNHVKIARIEIEKTNELNSAKLQFFSNVSHELLTPLNIISCGLNDLKHSNYNHDKLYDIIKSNITRLLHLTEQILEFRKADTGNLKLKVEYGDLRELIFSIVQNDFMVLINKKNLTLKVDCQISPINGYFDRDKVTKIIFNLLSNACKYNIEGGEIRVAIESIDNNGQNIQIKISNTGNVISEEQQKSLFKRFYDGAYRQYNTKGVGIGLSLTKDLVELHKGIITVQSSQECGTTFTINFPLYKEIYTTEIAECNSESVTASSLDSKSNELSDNNVDNSVDNDIEEGSMCDNYLEETDVDTEMDDAEMYTILLAEDDVECQYVVESFLRRNYNVIIANDGVEALDLAIRHNPDIIISDVIMPNMDGYELCSAIKSDINVSHTPVILLTAKRGKESQLEGLGSGAESYLTKPIDLEILSSQIKSLLKGREILSQHLRKDSITLKPDTKYKSVNEQFLERAVSVIHENISNQMFACTELQDALHVTKSTLYRKIKVLANMSPIEFIRHIRLIYARDLLNTNDKITISEVSYSAGFGSPRYFSSCFKKEFGISPKQYLEEREQLRESE